MIVHTNPVNINVRFHCHLMNCLFISYIAYVDQKIDFDELSEIFVIDIPVHEKKIKTTAQRNQITRTLKTWSDTGPLKESETIRTKLQYTKMKIGFATEM